MAAIRSHAERLSPRRWAASSNRRLSSVDRRIFTSSVLRGFLVGGLRAMWGTYHPQMGIIQNRVDMFVVCGYK
jgi:hypothetical protein